MTNPKKQQTVLFAIGALLTMILVSIFLGANGYFDKALKPVERIEDQKSAFEKGLDYGFELQAQTPQNLTKVYDVCYKVDTEQISVSDDEQVNSFAIGCMMPLMFSLTEEELPAIEIESSATKLFIWERARRLLDDKPMSKKRLVEQFVSEGLDEGTASSALDVLPVDWNQIAYESGKSWAASEHFTGTRKGMLDFLAGDAEGFTLAEAEAAIRLHGLAASSESSILRQEATEKMNAKLKRLNSYSGGGKWFKDPFPDASGLSVGVFLDAYSSGDTGCAIWWYPTDEDAEIALGYGHINLYSSFYRKWTLPNSETTLVLVSWTASQGCFKEAESILGFAR